MTEEEAISKIEEYRSLRQQATAVGDIEKVVECRNETGKLTAEVRKLRMGREKHHE